MKTSKLALKSAVHPQVEEVPLPLEIHPSVDPELARGLLAAAEHIDKYPEEYRMGAGYNLGKGTVGCVICHVERLSNWNRPSLIPGCNSMEAPIGSWAKIWGLDQWRLQGFMDTKPTTTIARIEWFLRTGE